MFFDRVAWTIYKREGWDWVTVLGPVTRYRAECWIETARQLNPLAEYSARLYRN